MIGFASTLIDRKHSYIIPSIVESGNNKTYKMKLPLGSHVITTSATLTSNTSSNVTLATDGFFSNKVDNLLAEFTIPNTSSVLVLNGKSILYADAGSSNISVQSPTSIYEAQALVYNDEIHILGGGYESYAHYKWNNNDKKWISFKYLGFGLRGGSAVVYNNEIHILGGRYTESTKRMHYKWDAATDTWSSVSSLPFDLYNGSAVVYNNEIHIMGGGGGSTSASNNHYKWNGTSWTNVGNIPTGFIAGDAILHNGSIHLLGGYDTSQTKYTHLSWNSSGVNTQYPSLPYAFSRGSAVSYHGEIYIFGSEESGQDKKMYVFNGTSWNNTVKKSSIRLTKNMKINKNVITDIIALAPVGQKSTLVQY